MGKGAVDACYMTRWWQCGGVEVVISGEVVVRVVIVVLVVVLVAVAAAVVWWASLLFVCIRPRSLCHYLFSVLETASYCVDDVAEAGLQ